MKRVKIFISLDDTDEIGYRYSTGMICEKIREHIVTFYKTKAEVITRHQLYLSDDIPYTSHNSSMCFVVFLSEKEKKDAVRFVVNFVKILSAPSASPGVCIGAEGEIKDVDSLVRYGLDAKKRILTKVDAYKIAKKNNMFLFEFKNGGNGVIGAVAGLALRVYGNDGRVKGRVHIKQKQILVGDILEDYCIDDIRLENGDSLSENSVIVLPDPEIKLVYMNHKRVLLVEKIDDFYCPVEMKKIKRF